MFLCDAITGTDRFLHRHTKEQFAHDVFLRVAVLLESVYSWTVVDINQLRILCKQGKIRWTNHILVRLLERSIKQSDVENAINTGTVIEQYPDDYPHPSCLVLGFTIQRQLLHVVCGIAQEHIYMITAYYPSPEKWAENATQRRS